MNKKTKKPLKRRTKKKIFRKRTKLKDILPINVENELLLSRTLFLSNAIDEKSATKLIKEILVLERLNNKLPILLWINSPGGYVNEGYAIINTFRAVKSKIITVINGEACSMASIIASCGDERCITVNSWWMGHDMTAGIVDYSRKIESRAKMIKRLWEQLERTLIQHTKLSKEDLLELRNGELWLSAEEAVAKGVVDRVV